MTMAADPPVELPAQFVAFQLGSEEFAIHVAQVEEIVRLMAITALPRAPGHVLGVINLRGRVVPVIDLARRFGMPASERTKRSRIVLVTMNGATVGMLVDAVSEVLRMPAGAIEPAPPVMRRTAGAELLGIGRIDSRLLIMLDPSRLLLNEEVPVPEAEP